MKKVLCIILSTVMLLSVLAVAACNGDDKQKESGAPAESGTASAGESAAPDPEDKNVIIPVEPDYFRLLCENTEAKIDSYCYSRQLHFNLISGSPLTEETELELYFDKEANFTFGYDFVEYAMPGSIAKATYKYNDWAERAAGLSGVESSAEVSELANLHFEASAEDVGLYSYLVYLTFDSKQPEDELLLSKLTISLDGRSRSYDIGSIIISSKKDLNTDSTFRIGSVGLTDVNVRIGADGRFVIPEFDAEIKDDVVIKDIYASYGDITFTKVSVVRRDTEGDTIEFLWDPEGNEPLEFSKGDSVTITIEAVNPLFANTLYAASKFNLIISYGGELEGSITYIDLSFRMRDNPFYAYLQLDCGKDALSYFTVYKAKE